MTLADHPTVRHFEANLSDRTATSLQPLDASWLRQLALDCGADDAGLVEIGNPALDDQRADKFGNFILLGTVLLGGEASEYDRSIDYNPCLSCKLCVAACPVGAIGSDGHFDMASCYTHNYREFMGGFGDWVEHVADARSGLELRTKVTRQETVSVWQSLAFGPNYKAAYCLSVCPTGEDVIGPFLTDKKTFLNEIVKPLQEKQETIYVVPKSDAEAHVRKRFPLKTVKHVRGSLLPRTIAGFLTGITHTFQRGQSEGLNAVFHSTFTGAEPQTATVVIRDKTLQVNEGHEGTPDLQLTADSETWLGFLAKERSLLWALLRRKIRIKGSPRLLIAFGKCFPS